MHLLHVIWDCLAVVGALCVAVGIYALYSLATDKNPEL